MTQRAKTTSASTPGSFAPHTRSASEATLEPDVDALWERYVEAFTESESVSKAFLETNLPDGVQSVTLFWSDQGDFLDIERMTADDGETIEGDDLWDLADWDDLSAAATNIENPGLVGLHSPDDYRYVVDRTDAEPVTSEALVASATAAREAQYALESAAVARAKALIPDEFDSVTLECSDQGDYLTLATASGDGVDEVDFDAGAWGELDDFVSRIGAEPTQSAFKAGLEVHAQNTHSNPRFIIRRA